MRTTRAYAAGFGTAGSMLAVASILFVLGSAIVAFQGWPRIASQGPPAVVQITGTPAPSRVSRRLRAVAPSAGVATAAAGIRAGTRAASPAVGTIGVGGSTPPAGIAPGTSRRPVPPTNPPVTVTVPTGAVPGPVKSVVKKVTGTAGSTVSNSATRVGSTVGGPVGQTVTKVGQTAGSTISQLGN